MIKPMTENNWLQQGFNEAPGPLIRRLYDDEFVMKFSSVKREIESIERESRMAAIKINLQFGKVALALSGGKDSEIMLRSFLKEDLPIDIWTIRFWDGDKLINEDDLAESTLTAKECCVKQNFYDLEIRSFFDSEFCWQLVTRCGTKTLITTAMAALIFSLKLPLILGAGDPLFFRWPSRERAIWFYQESEYTMEWHSSFQGLSRSGVPGFFYYTPELFASFLTSHHYLKLLTQNSTESDSVNAKYRLYDSITPLRLRPKRNGCENIDLKYWNAFSIESQRRTSKIKRSANYKRGFVIPVKELYHSLLPNVSFSVLGDC